MDCNKTCSNQTGVADVNVDGYMLKISCCCNTISIWVIQMQSIFILAIAFYIYV
jgi:hypothetical protein